MSEAPNLEDAKGWKMRETLHGHGKGFFLYEYGVIDHMRLRRRDRYTRKDRSVTSTWLVDGQDCKDLEDALAKMATPPSFDESELLVLRLIAKMVEERGGPIACREIPYDATFQLSYKGALDTQAGKMQLSAIGKAAIEAAEKSPLEEGASDAAL